MKLMWRQCGDVLFTDAQQALPSACQNGTNVVATPLPAGDDIDANMSNPMGGMQSGEEDGASATAASAGASSTSSGSGAVRTVVPVVAGWGVLGAGVVGAVALL
jgi:hypothetical protein